MRAAAGKQAVRNMQAASDWATCLGQTKAQRRGTRKTVHPSETWGHEGDRQPAANFGGW